MTGRRATDTMFTEEHLGKPYLANEEVMTRLHRLTGSTGLCYDLSHGRLFSGPEQVQMTT